MFIYLRVYIVRGTDLNRVIGLFFIYLILLIYIM